MTSDVRINVGLPSHPKTKRLIRRLGTDAAWRLVCLMAWVAANRPEAKIEGVLMVEMIEDAGTEMILGSVKDPGLGNLIMVGLGGIFVELFQDVAFGLNPLSRSDIETMLSSLKAKNMSKRV